MGHEVATASIDSTENETFQNIRESDIKNRRKFSNMHETVDNGQWRRKIHGWLRELKHNHFYAT